MEKQTKIMIVLLMADIIVIAYAVTLFFNLDLF